MASKKMIRVFYGVCAAHSLSEVERDAILNGCGVDSITALSDAEIVNIVNRLNQSHSNAVSAKDMWRKRVMAVIGEWLRRQCRQQSAEIIIGIACKAAGAKDFNSINLSKLRALYNEFLIRNRMPIHVDKAIQEELTINLSSN